MLIMMAKKDLCDELNLCLTLNGDGTAVPLLSLAFGVVSAGQPVVTADCYVCLSFAMT